MKANVLGSWSLGPVAGLVTQERRCASVALVLAFVGGTITQALFWRTSLGLNFLIWDLLVLAGAVGFLRRGAIPTAAWGAMTASVLLGFSVVLHESRWTLVLAVPATLLALASLPLLLRGRHGMATLGRVPLHLVPSFARASTAMADAARIPRLALGRTIGSVIQPMVRGSVVGLPVAGIFAVLLSSDPDFARTLRLLRAELGDVALFAAWSVVTAAGYLFALALHGRETPAVAGEEQDDPYRRFPIAEVPTPTPRVSVVAWASVVGQVALVFALFVAATARHLFGGNAFVRSEEGLTYATWLHAGVGELLAATVLSVCLVLAGHRALRPRGQVSQSGPVPGGRLLAWLEGTLLVLTAATLVSCAQRLWIYEDAYGASRLRLGVAFLELLVLGVLALTFAKVVFRGWAGHAGAVLTLALAVTLVACGFDSDAYIARRNLDRAAEGKALDVDYLASLSGDARATMTHPFVRERPELEARLREAFCAPRAGGWRAFRGLGRCTEAAP